LRGGRYIHELHAPAPREGAAPPVAAADPPNVGSPAMGPR
jgi:hypothetical protein